MKNDLMHSLKCEGKKSKLSTLRQPAYQPIGLWFRLDASSVAGHSLLIPF